MSGMVLLLSMELRLGDLASSSVSFVQSGFEANAALWSEPNFSPSHNATSCHSTTAKIMRYNDVFYTGELISTPNTSRTIHSELFPPVSFRGRASVFNSNSSTFEGYPTIVGNTHPYTHSAQLESQQN